MRSAAKGYLVLFLVASCASALRAQTIEIKLVNGKTGRPVAGVCVSVWMTKDTRKTATIRTDKNGVAQLHLTHNDNEVDVSPDLKLGCGGNGAINPVLKDDGSLRAYTAVDAPSCVFSENLSKARWKEMDPISTKEVLKHGFVSANTCGKATASPQPGEVILFVRPRNFRDKVQDWQNSEAFPF